MMCVCVCVYELVGGRVDRIVERVLGSLHMHMLPSVNSSIGRVLCVSVLYL